MSAKKILQGNDAMALGVVEAGCAVASAYPGTPSSEILPGIAKYADELGTNTVVEWGANEKVSLEIALGASMASKRSCAVMKQVGLNVAADPFMSAAHFKLPGGCLLIVSDDPGCHASQTDQDSRNFALFAKIPCFDPCDAREARDMVHRAYELSERHKVMAMLRPAVRVDHCRQSMETEGPLTPQKPAHFEQEPRGHKAILPARMIQSIKEHNQRFEAIREEFESDFGSYNYEVPAKGKATLGIIASGVSFSIVMDLLRDLGREDIGVLKIGTPVPLPVRMVEDFIARYDTVMVLEETYGVMEEQLPDRTKIKGRWNNEVPRQGELVPEVIRDLLFQALGEEAPSQEETSLLVKAQEALHLAKRPPKLCAGCPHRPSYFALRKALPKSIICSDIGCYSLSFFQGTVDSIVCMGGAVTVASGVYTAYKADGKVGEKPIFATLGDSTFFHSGMTGLATAVYNKHAFVLCILDNSITAMTGGQDNPGTGSKMRSGDEGAQVNLEEAVKGCGVKYLEVLNAYAINDNLETIKKAHEWAVTNEQPAVLIFRYPCITMLKKRPEKKPVFVDSDTCIGCKICITKFNCPGLLWNEETKKAYVDHRFCVDCGVCTEVCPKGAIRFVQKEEA
ncbi:MAG TPA: indolepyruvate ferredoxin oxidoreductase subunit alpha [Synergistaceae bacterium]|nr:indolepyruvate ferredoxin oxidoreductase subunit alpha [Synergistaceae bacterium]HPJ25049.1 indolepyruvate ferredoxin oxidoreductase subunit alpha [Synergistaceae bacterium]HPQ38223.1 indolepyruvate ferredoxin oxidoreductase subunit alpha [Synergistaceae bacterium]